METKPNNVKYLIKVFKGLPVEKKDYVLNTAKSLLIIQDSNTYPLFVDKPASNSKTYLGEHFGNH